VTDEHAPRWYVVVDDTPVLPERPLTMEQAIDLFREMVESDGADGAEVEIRQCSEEDFEWASGG